MSRSAHSPDNMSVEEFSVYETPEGKAELVRGELQMTPSPGGSHGVVAVALIARLHGYVSSAKLGRVFDNASFELVQRPRTVRAPDVAFVRRDRLPAEIGEGFVRVTPDLAVEVRSPSETRARIQEKVDDYRACGIPLIWIVDPARRTVLVIDERGSTRVLGEGDVLDGGSVVPGFVCSVGELFADLTVS